MDDKFEIETGIPVRQGRNRKVPYPFAELKVGDSFVAKNSRSKNLQSNLLFSANAWAVRKKNGRSFTTSKIEGGVRIWRTA